MKSLRIGVDFDNTIVSYEGVFYRAALEKHLIPRELAPAKGAVRDYLRAQGKEKEWTELQGYIYGARMDLAHPYPGVDAFFSLCFKKHIPIFIISHKTLHPFLGPPYDLHKSADEWLQRQNFSWTPPTFFELTLEAKLQRIYQQECTIFIDDLPELLREKTFPANVQKILFDPHQLYSSSNDYHSAMNWDEICQILKISDYGS